MLKIVQRRLRIRLRPQEASQVQQSLQARFNSLLAGVRLEYLRRLGLDSEPSAAFAPSEEASLLAGEIFMPEPGTILYVKYLRDQDCLEAGAISNHRERDFDNFFAEVMEAVVEAQPGNHDWEHGGPEAGSELDEARPVSTEISEKELEAASEFLKPKSKALLEQLSQTESTLMNKLNHPPAELESLLAHLEDLDLIRKDYAVLSKETGQQILRVTTKASLEESKFFSGEPVDEVISCTSFCRGLMENDQWLLNLVLGTLSTLGLEQGRESLSVVQQANSPIQLYLGINEQRFLLVLVNHRLSVDDSYLISAQVSACNLRDVIVISTHKITRLMKHHLSGANPEVQFDFIDTMDNLEEQLGVVLVNKQRAHLRELLDPLSDLTPVRLHELVIRKMAPLSEDQEEVPAVSAAVLPTHTPEQLPELTPPPMAAPPPPPPMSEPAFQHRPSVEPLPELDLPAPTEAVPDPYDFASPELPTQEPAFDFPLDEMVPRLPVDDFDAPIPAPRVAPPPPTPPQTLGPPPGPPVYAGPPRPAPGPGQMQPQRPAAPGQPGPPTMRPPGPPPGQLGMHPQPAHPQGQLGAHPQGQLGGHPQHTGPRPQHPSELPPLS